MDIRDVLREIATPRDLGAVLLAYVAGFALDVTYFPGGIEAGTIGLLAAAGALGAKKLFQPPVPSERRLALPPATGSPTNDRAVASSSALKERAKALIAVLETGGFTPEAGRLRDDLNLCEAGLVAPELLRKTIDALVEVYRARPMETVTCAGSRWALTDLSETHDGWIASLQAVDAPHSTMKAGVDGPQAVRPDRLPDILGNIVERTFADWGSDVWTARRASDLDHDPLAWDFLSSDKSYRVTLKQSMGSLRDTDLQRIAYDLEHPGGIEPTRSARR